MTIFHVNKESVASQIVDGEAVVINSNTSEYFSLNHFGTVIWQEINTATETLEKLTETTALNYGIPTHCVAKDVEDFTERLLEYKLISPCKNVTSEQTNCVVNSAIELPSGPYEPPKIEKFGDLQTLILSGE